MLKARNVFMLQRRWKGGKKRWNALQFKKTNCDRALESFDDFYGSVYGTRWKNMRVALLTEHKYIAMVNNFGDTEQTCSMLEMDGAINVKSLINVARERLDGKTDNSVSTKLPSSNNVDSKLDALLKKQQEREMASIYPSASEDGMPQQLNYNSSEKNQSTQEELEPQDFKQSLTKALEEDVHLDEKRLVDPQFGTGGLYEYMPAHSIKGMEDWVAESEHYKYYKTNDAFPLRIELEDSFQFPEHLALYTYEMGNCSNFKAPKKCLTGVLSHFLMDGASTLPPLFLQIQPGDRVLDACAAPGGKSLLMLQTLHSDLLVCNDVQESRVNKLRRVMQEYLFDFRERWEGKRLILTQSDARNLSEYASYDKILVDVPCTTDRHSLMEQDNNIFKPTRIKERLRIPELQAGILANCLRLLRPGGSLVYSTCSLSPVQNDGVVHMALEKVFTEHGITTTIKDLSLQVELFSDIFKFEYPKGLKYGQMVIPFLPANFGPMYFSKIVRNT
ncbi:5-methylcytosine rRNA methyltransferase NSUN4 isoform X1 [Scaptodrosophila lebanonensis]|uniref:NOL1/NOP2/Sun domain family member 4 n=1 Tax=Drosophila lebanonensis TaxID=7225 RepID=A0A6J2U5Y3_DROLE|nr:5-methylcytosine rRNA methyltransferase NSUN4 isoform X1 [Scaptodrosophila lebanonensis]